MQQGFSKFSWALALFCVPSALWPLALLVSPKFSDNPNLTPSQIDWFSIAFWVYPFVLFMLSGIFYKIHQRNQSLGKGLLAVGFVGFYALAVYIFKTV